MAKKKTCTTCTHWIPYTDPKWGKCSKIPSRSDKAEISGYPCRYWNNLEIIDFDTAESFSCILHETEAIELIPLDE